MNPAVKIVTWATYMAIVGAMAGVFLGFFGPMVVSTPFDQETYGSGLLLGPVGFVLGGIGGAVIGYLTRNVDLG